MKENNPDTAFTSQEIKKLFDQLSDEEKQPYIKMHQEDRVRYDDELKK